MEEEGSKRKQLKPRAHRPQDKRRREAEISNRYVVLLRDAFERGLSFEDAVKYCDTTWALEKSVVNKVLEQNQRYPLNCSDRLKQDLINAWERWGKGNATD